MSEDQDLSLTERRLLDSVTDLPEYWEGSRPRSMGRGQASRYFEALRARLNWLVKIEERFGDEQEHLHRNRAERNALIWAISELAPSEVRVPRRTVHPPREYAARVLEVGADHLAQGFSADPQRPGMLVHEREDIAALKVSQGVWFYLVGLADSPPRLTDISS